MVEQIDPGAAIPPAPATASQPGPGGRQPSADIFARRPPTVDIATVLSMPETVLPAAIQDSFLQLVEEVERLREELERVKLHERYLQHAADRHVTLPVLNRGAFMQSLARLLETSQREDLPGSLLMLHVEGVEALRRASGMAAGDRALARVAELVLGELRQTDLFGYLDVSDFAVALAVATTEGAQAKLAQIAAALNTALDAGAPAIELPIILGMVSFQPGATADQSLSEADSDRRHRPITALLRLASPTP
jgi:diguanylate cyclase (GGDEF)-like protein